MATSYEVEQKYIVESHEAIVAQLKGTEFSPPEIEADTYYAHPVRDFAATDEALRIRETSSEAVVTYKGPKFDTEVKTREELELSLDGATEDWHALLQKLSFRPVAVVRKSRRKATLDWQGAKVLLTLDDVETLGTYAELEVVVGDEGELDEAKSLVLSLATFLGLGKVEPRSYLGMILGNEQDA